MGQKRSVNIGLLCLILLLVEACHIDKKKPQGIKQEQNQQGVKLKTSVDNIRDTCTVGTIHIDTDISKPYSINKSEIAIDSFNYKNVSLESLDVFYENLCNTDTVKEYKDEDIFKIPIIDSIFNIKDGYYAFCFGTNSGNRKFDFHVSSFEEIYTGKILSLLLIGENRMYTIRDTFSYVKHGFVGFTISHHTSLPYVDYLTVGNYISPDGKIYNPESDMIEDGDDWKYCVNKIYGVTNKGKLDLLKNNLWGAYTLKELYHQAVNDTIEFVNPMP